MVTGRQTAGVGKKAPAQPCRTALGCLCAAVILCVSACADIWGFGELGNSTDAGGAGGWGMIVAIEGTGGSGGNADSGAGGGGGTGTGGASAGSGGSGGLGATGGVTGAGGATGGVTGAGGVAGARGTGGVSGLGGMTGTGGATVTGTGGAAGARGTGGVSGTGGLAGTGGATGAGGAPACGPTNCANGCCAGTRCVTATSATQCGTNGGACAACGGCQLCGTNGACAVNPASNWMIQCGSAVLTTAPPTGTTWDPAGVAGDGTAPDPFCQFEKPARVIDANTGAATRTINDSFTATWNQTVTAGNTTITAADLMSASPDTWRVWVGDSEFNGLAPLACEVRPPLQASALIDGRLTVANVQNCVSLTLTLVCRP